MGNNLLNINGYKIEREDRNNRGDGVAFYVKSSINYARRKDIPLDALELVCIEIKPVKASPFIIIAWYRPPSDPILTFDKLEKVLQYLENENKEILLIGDTNCNLLHQEVLQSPNSDLAPAFGSTGTADANTSSGMCKHMIDLYETYGLKQIIKEPTRVTLHTSTLIDHVAVSDPRNIADSGVLKIAMSNHYMVYCVRKFRGALTKQHKKITTRQMKNFDETSFFADISSVDWNLIIQRSADLDSAVENWTTMLSLIIEKHAPMRQHRVSDRYCPWLTSELKATMRSRDKLKKSAVKHGSALLMQAYRRIRNRVNSLNTKLKKAYFSQKIADCQGNMKETWNTINKLINKRSKTTNISSLVVDEACLTNSSEIADSMNDYFCNMGSKLSSKIPNIEKPLINGDYSINEDHTRFHFQMIRPDELIIIMNKFKTSQSCGIDGISSSFLKITMPVLAPSLCSIFNTSISQGCFP